MFYHFQGTSYTHSQLTLRLALREQLHSYPFSSLQKKENVHRRVVWTVPVTQKYFIHMFIQMCILSYSSYNSTVKQALLVYLGFYELSDPAGKPRPKALCSGLLALKFQCSSSSPAAPSPPRALFVLALVIISSPSTTKLCLQKPLSGFVPSHGHRASAWEPRSASTAGSPTW